MRPTPASFAASATFAAAALSRSRKPGLADRMHEVVDDVDGSGRGERRAHRRRIVGIQGDPGDLSCQPKPASLPGIARGGDDLVPVLEQLRGEPRADIAVAPATTPGLIPTALNGLLPRSRFNLGGGLDDANSSLSRARLRVVPARWSSGTLRA